MQRSFNILILFLLCALAGHAEAEPVSNYEIIARLTQVHIIGGCDYKTPLTPARVEFFLRAKQVLEVAQDYPDGTDQGQRAISWFHAAGSLDPQRI
jgi:hypothetical protein